MPPIAARQHSAHHPLTGEVDGGVPVCTVAPALLRVGPAIVVPVIGFVVEIEGRRQYRQPRRDVARPPIRDKPPSQPKVAFHVWCAERYNSFEYRDHGVPSRVSGRVLLARTWPRTGLGSPSRVWNVLCPFSTTSAPVW